jgi:hypothetical protein
LRWLERFIDERLPALTEVALAVPSCSPVQVWMFGAGRATMLE